MYIEHVHQYYLQVLYWKYMLRNTRILIQFNCLPNLVIRFWRITFPVSYRSPISDNLNLICSYMMLCMVFITFSLLEYGCLLVIWKYFSWPKAYEQKIFKRIDVICFCNSALLFIIGNFVFILNTNEFRK